MDIAVAAWTSHVVGAIRMDERNDENVLNGSPDASTQVLQHNRPLAAVDAPASGR